MKKITNFTVKKAYEPEVPNPKLPQRKLSANVGTNEDPEWVDIGSGWVKTDSKGSPYISVALETDRTYKKKDGTEVTVDGWTLVKTKELEKLLAGETEIIPKGLDTGEVINPDDIPF